MQETSATFNFAGLFYVELHKLRLLKIQAIIAGDIDSYLRAVDQMFVQISFKINKTEYHDIDKLLTDAKRSVMQNWKTQNNMFYARIDAFEKLRLVEVAILKVMHKYHMIFPKLVIPSFKMIDERYGLNEDG